MLETARRFPGAVRELFLSQLGLCSAAFPHSGVSERVVSCLFPSSEATRCPSPASGTWVCSLLGNSFQINRQELSYFILVSQIGGGARWLNQCLHSVSPRVALLLNSTGKLFLEWDDGIGIIICWRKWKKKQTNKQKKNQYFMIYQQLFPVYLAGKGTRICSDIKHCFFCETHEGSRGL